MMVARSSAGVAGVAVVMRDNTIVLCDAEMGIEVTTMRPQSSSKVGDSTWLAVNSPGDGLPWCSRCKLGCSHVRAPRPRVEHVKATYNSKCCRLDLSTRAALLCTLL